MGLKNLLKNSALFLSLAAASVNAQQKIAPALDGALILTDREENNLNEGNHIVVNIPAFRLYWCKGNEIVKEYRISVGRIGVQSIEGHFNIDYKTRNPGYKPVEGSLYKKVADYFPPGKNNPMGTRAMHFFGHLYVHGLSEEKRESIEKTKGGRCIGLLKEDIEELYDYVKTGTPIDLYYRTTLINDEQSELSFKQLNNVYKSWRLCLDKKSGVENIQNKIRKKPIHSIDSSKFSGKKLEDCEFDKEALDDILIISK